MPISSRPSCFVGQFQSKKTNRIYHSLKATKQNKPIN